MKKTILIILAVAILFLAGWAILQSGNKSEDENRKNGQNNNQSKNYTLEESRLLAQNWMENECPTYVYDGENLMLQESLKINQSECEDCYQFEFTFKSRHGGYGDREGQMITQAITPHITVVTVENGEVAKALTDNQFNEITEEIRQGGQGVDRLQPQTVDLYFYNKNQDKDEEGNIICSPEAVTPVERVIPNKNPIKESIELLLKGRLTEKEKEEGFSTEFPNDDFELENIELNESDGELILTFTEVPGFTTGGSCRVTLLKAQIEKTAEQFPEVEEVAIEPETLFQP
jgi:spore germination protein GerM